MTSDINQVVTNVIVRYANPESDIAILALAEEWRRQKEWYVIMQNIGQTTKWSVIPIFDKSLHTEIKVALEINDSESRGGI